MKKKFKNVLYNENTIIHLSIVFTLTLTHHVHSRPNQDQHSDQHQLDYPNSRSPIRQTDRRREGVHSDYLQEWKRIQRTGFSYPYLLLPTGSEEKEIQ
jgi:hypothetical protein